jgi:hypothetical protein
VRESYRASTRTRHPLCQPLGFQPASSATALATATFAATSSHALNLGHLEDPVVEVLVVHALSYAHQPHLAMVAG